jgi:hypothetical protein
MPDKCSTGDAEDQSIQVQPGPGPSTAFQFSLRSLLFSLVVICVLLALLVPLIRSARRSAQRMSCLNNLKQIVLALHNYHDAFKTFPWAITYAADGTSMHSWRVRIYPFLEQSSFFSVYDSNEPWNGPKNKLLGDEIPDTFYDKPGNAFQFLHDAGVYRCPSAPPSQNRMCTNYVMLIDDRPGRPNGPPNLPSSVPPSFDDKSAVIIIEIADSDIHWMEPRDVLLSELSMKINDRSQRSLSSYHGGACVLHADGTVEVLDDTTTEERVRELLTQ